jgi:uncharacterized protein YjbI with pentapeptide repeats
LLRAGISLADPFFTVSSLAGSNRPASPTSTPLLANTGTSGTALAGISLSEKKLRESGFTKSTHDGWPSSSPTRGGSVLAKARLRRLGFAIAPFNRIEFSEADLGAVTRTGVCLGGTKVVERELGTTGAIGSCTA